MCKRACDVESGGDLEVGKCRLKERDGSRSIVRRQVEKVDGGREWIDVEWREKDVMVKR